MLSLADRVIELLYTPEKMMHSTVIESHPNIKGKINELISDIKDARKYIFEDATSKKIHEQSVTSVGTLLNRIPLAIPRLEHMWLEYGYHEDGPDDYVREGMLVKNFKEGYMVSLYTDNGSNLARVVPHTATLIFSVLGHAAVDAANFPRSYFKPYHSGYTEEDYRKLFSKVSVIPQSYFYKPITDVHPLQSEEYQSIIETMMGEHHLRARQIMWCINVLSIINNIPLTYTDVQPAQPFRLKGKAQKIQRLRGIQQVSLSLEKGQTIKRYLTKALKSYNSNGEGSPKGEHSVIEHDRVYYRGTDKEFVVKIPAHKRGLGETKTERRFIVRE